MDKSGQPAEKKSGEDTKSKTSERGTAGKGKADGNRKRLIIIAALILLCLLIIIIALVLLFGGRDDANTDEVVFLTPAGLMVGDGGYIYVADSGNNIIVRMDSSGDTKELFTGCILPADMYGNHAGGYNDGSSSEALFDGPYDLEEWEGGIAVSDTGNNVIRFVSEDGTVRTLAGTGAAGCHNDRAYNATFNAPMGMAVGPDGYLYVADSGNGVIRSISPDGDVETPVGGLDTPAGLCWDDDLLYITDMGTNLIYVWDGDELTRVAGVEYTDEDLDLVDGDADEAVFSSPHGIYAADGVIYVADTGFSAVRKIADGQVETLEISGGTGTNLWPSAPTGVIMEDSVLYVSDAFIGVVFVISDP